MSSEKEYKEFVFPFPKEKIALLIGKKGENKRLLESQLDVKISIDNEEGIIKCKMLKNDAFLEMKLFEILDAISNAIPPEEAIKLLNENYMLYHINLREVYEGNKKAITRYKGRIIGEKGSFKKKIEEYTNTYISINGDNIYIIGKIDDVLIAKEAIEMIIQGAKHSSVLMFLERKALERNLMLE